MEEFLNTLLKSLNQIEVRGRQNLDVLLGCIMAVESAIEQVPEEEEDNGRQTDM